MSHGDLPFASGWFLQGTTCTINYLNVAGVMQQKWNDGNWSYKPSFAVNDICWLISLYFTTDRVTRKGNWPIQQVLYLPAFFLVPPLTILTKQCMPFSWFQQLFNVCLIISRHRRTRFSQEEQPIHTRWCMLKCVGELHGPKEINSLKVVWDGAISCHLVDH